MSFEIKTLDDLRKIMVLARGGDPDAQQTLNDFLKFKDNIERTNLPTRRDVQMIAYLDYAGKTFYKGKEDNPFTKAANCVAVAFMAKGGDKSKQFVEMMKKAPDLSMLSTGQQEPQRQGLFARLRGKPNAEA